MPKTGRARESSRGHVGKKLNLAAACFCLDFLRLGPLRTDSIFLFSQPQCFLLRVRLLKQEQEALERQRAAQEAAAWQSCACSSARHQPAWLLAGGRFPVMSCEEVKRCHWQTVHGCTSGCLTSPQCQSPMVFALAGSISPVSPLTSMTFFTVASRSGPQIFTRRSRVCKQLR